MYNEMSINHPDVIDEILEIADKVANEKVRLDNV